MRTAILPPLAVSFLGGCLIFAQVAAGVVRPNVKDLTDSQRSNFVRCVLWLETQPSGYDGSQSSGLNAYDWLVWLHNQGFATHLTGGSGVHMAPSFFPWHREFLRAFETELGRAARALGITDPVAIPYWDWTDPAAVAFVFRDDFMGGNGGGSGASFSTGVPATRGSPFRVLTGPFATRDDRSGEFPINTNTTVSGNSPQGPPRTFLQRSVATHQIFGGPPPLGTVPPVTPTPEQVAYLPPAEQVGRAFEMGTYDVSRWDNTVETNVPFLERTTFRNYMEGHTGLFSVLQEPFGDQLHGRVHIWVGGNMSASSSPNDPVFWLHHANLDRLWAEWQDRQGLFNFPGEWFYVDADGKDHTVNAADLLWGFSKAVNYPADVTSLDTLDLRASGVRYDTMPEATPTVVRASIEGTVNGQEVLVRVPAIKGLGYRLEARAALSEAWLPVGAVVVAAGSEVVFQVPLADAAASRFFRISVNAVGSQPAQISATERAAWQARKNDPVCGIPPGGWPGL